MALSEATRNKLIWGWLRLFLGWLQMSLVAVSIGAMLAAGLQPVTYVLVVAATIATLTSRLLYRGRPAPRVGNSWRANCDTMDEQSKPQEERTMHSTSVAPGLSELRPHCGANNGQRNRRYSGAANKNQYRGTEFLL